MDDAPSCPLCAEELDATDRGFFPCRCRFQVCPFCYGRLKESSGQCPGCRASYDDQEPVYEEPDFEKLRQEREMQKQKDRAMRQESSKSMESLANVRVIQRNLVYVTGLSLKHAYDEILAGPKWFKPYGRILKCVANRTVQYNTTSPHGPTVSAYVTYAEDDDALEAIRALDNTMHDGHVLRCSFGTTKYCNSFLRGMECTIPDCMYLHKIQENDDTYLRAQLSKGQDSRTRAEFHDKTHPQFQEEQAALLAAASPPIDQHSQGLVQPTVSKSSVALPAPLPKSSQTVKNRTQSNAQPNPVPGPVPQQPTQPPQQPVRSTAAAEIPIPRPAPPKQTKQTTPTLKPAVISAAPGAIGARSSSAPLNSSSSQLVGVVGRRGQAADPWGVSAQPQPHDPEVTLSKLENCELDPVASVASAALSSASLFSAFASSQPNPAPVSYTHLRAHETPEHLVCRLLLEKKKKRNI
eukprot:TRINITY_DN11145_c0_g1_i1.p1 TRINITY_DN11145_c0_g1~~TRINITY_DN11145_c0_g1_i1.p1  ORF type:complete len:466 (-),score=112.29 TRINITY_DN11145_c0_g1_i1:83-1480(-)